MLNNTKFKQTTQGWYLFLFKSLPEIIQQKINDYEKENNTKLLDGGGFISYYGSIYDKKLIEIIIGVLVQNNELILKKYPSPLNKDTLYNHYLYIFVGKIIFNLIESSNQDKDGFLVIRNNKKNEKNRNEIINHIKETMESFFDNSKHITLIDTLIAYDSLPTKIKMMLNDQYGIHNKTKTIALTTIINAILTKILDENKKINDAINKDIISEEQIVKIITDYLHEKIICQKPSNEIEKKNYGKDDNENNNKDTNLINIIPQKNEDVKQHIEIIEKFKPFN